MGNDDEMAEIKQELQETTALVEALRRRTNLLDDELEELKHENERLRDQLADIQEVVNPDPASQEYEAMTRPQKVYKIRRTLVEQAASRTKGDRAMMTYKDVMFLFDGHPSPGHTYDLMELAGNLEGFEYQDREDRQKRIVVNLDDVKDETFVRVANNAENKKGVI